ncbi:MAG: molybdopterin cofactor-binding domain-containing protein, partial [Steroidobacteraceae bacterium]
MSADDATGFDPALSRRGFLQSMGGLVVAFNLFGRAMPAAGAEQSPPLPVAGNLDAWLAVHPDNTATFFTGKVETGTGVETALAQFAAEELDFPFERLDVVMGTTSLTV